MRRLMAVCAVSLLFVTGCGKKDSTPTAPVIPAPPPLMSYPAAWDGVDRISRGFYIPSYPGASLSSATLWLSAAASGTYKVHLAVRAATYAGTLIDSTTTTVMLGPAMSDTVRTTFKFSNAGIAPATPVTFALSLVSGPNPNVYFVVTGDYGGRSGSAINLVETEGTTPPLDVQRNLGIAIVLRGSSN